MNLEFVHHVANYKATLGHLGLQGLKIHQRASQPSQVSTITPGMEVSMFLKSTSQSRLISSLLYPVLSLAPPLPILGEKGEYKDSCSHEGMVFHGDLSAQGIVSVPLLHKDLAILTSDLPNFVSGLLFTLVVSLWAESGSIPFSDSFSNQVL